MNDVARVGLVGLLGAVLAVLLMWGFVSSQSGADTVKQPGVIYGQTSPLVP
jgi:hypothetical protein